MKSEDYDIKRKNYDMLTQIYEVEIMTKSHNEHTNVVYKMKQNFNIKFIFNTMMTLKVIFMR